MSRIFISYRREDTQDAAGRLYDALAQHFGRDQVFMDVDTIPPGVDFVEFIEAEVARCDVLIALIGRQWLTVADSTGRRRLNRPTDFVRMEIVAALRRDIRVVPVLVQGASMPSADELPRPLKGLARRNAVEFRHATWRSDVAALTRDLEAGTTVTVATPVPTQANPASETDRHGRHAGSDAGQPCQRDRPNRFSLSATEG